MTAHDLRSRNWFGRADLDGCIVDFLRGRAAVRAADAAGPSPA